MTSSRHSNGKHRHPGAEDQAENTQDDGSHDLTRLHRSHLLHLAPGSQVERDTPPREMGAMPADRSWAARPSAACRAPPAVIFASISGPPGRIPNFSISPREYVTRLQPENPVGTRRATFYGCSAQPLLCTLHRNFRTERAAITPPVAAMSRRIRSLPARTRRRRSSSRRSTFPRASRSRSVPACRGWSWRRGEGHPPQSASGRSR